MRSRFENMRSRFEGYFKLIFIMVDMGNLNNMLRYFTMVDSNNLDVNLESYVNYVGIG